MTTNVVRIPGKQGFAAFVPLEEAQSEAQKFAESKGFQQRCINQLLWKGEDQGELLHFVNGAVKHFRPRNAHELDLLKNIIEAQLMVERAATARKEVAELDGVDWSTGRPAGKVMASDKFGKEQLALLRTLEKAISMYNRNRR